MAQKKTNEVDSWLARPDPGVRIVLVYGPDRGLVSERARLFVKSSGLDAEDPFSSIRLEAGEIESAPGRLIDEANTMAMFSARRLIWIKNAGAQKQLAEEVKTVAASPPPDAVILVEAGDLKKGAALRTTVENASAAMALPCYTDEARTVDTIIDEVFAREGLKITSDVRLALRANLGGDRLATRGEIEKLALYCRGDNEVTLEAVMALTGDVSSLSVDHVVDAVISGNADAFDPAYSRFLASGNHPFLVLSATMRQFQLLALMRGEMDGSGKPAAAVVATARPPVFFTRKRLVETALQRWSTAALTRALERLHASVLLTRQRPDLAIATARQSLIALLVEAARASR